MIRSTCSDAMSQSSNRSGSDQTSTNTTEKTVEKQQPPADRSIHPFADIAHSQRLLQTYLGEFLVLELREAIHAASNKIIENNEKIESLEEKVRAYEDHIECLEQLVKELQLMLRTALQGEEQKEPGNAISEIHMTEQIMTTSASLVEIPLEESFHNEKETSKPPLPIQTTSASRLLSFLNCKANGGSSSLLTESKTKKGILKPASPEKRVDVHDGSLNDFN